MNSISCLVLTLLIVVLAHYGRAQSPVLTDPRLPDPKGWSAFFPQIEGCTMKVYPLTFTGFRSLIQNARYELVPVRSEPGEAVVATRNFDPITGQDATCEGSITITIDVPDSAMSAAELREIRRLEKSAARWKKKNEKLYRVPFVPCPRIPLRINEMDAYEQTHGCDVLGYEWFLPTTLVIPFDQNKQLNITINFGVSKAEEIVKKIDYKSLAAAMDHFLTSRIKPSK